MYTHTTQKWLSLCTVVVELFQVYSAGCVPEVDEGLTVSPALYDDATGLWVERKHCAVEVTRRLHHSTKPPSHSSSVMHVHTKQLEVLFIIELAGTAYNPQKHVRNTTNFNLFFYDKQLTLQLYTSAKKVTFLFRFVCWLICIQEYLFEVTDDFYEFWKWILWDQTMDGAKQFIRV